MPNGPEPLLLSFRAVTVDAEVWFVTGLTLLRLPDGIDRMREPVAQIVLSLHGLHDTAAARGCCHKNLLGGGPSNAQKRTRMAILAPGVLVALRARHVDCPHVLLVLIHPVLLVSLRPNDFDLRVTGLTIEGRISILMAGQAVIHHWPARP